MNMRSWHVVQDICKMKSKNEIVHVEDEIVTYIISLTIRCWYGCAIFCSHCRLLTSTLNSSTFWLSTYLSSLVPFTSKTISYTLNDSYYPLNIHFQHRYGRVVADWTGWLPPPDFPSTYRLWFTIHHQFLTFSMTLAISFTIPSTSNVQCRYGCAVADQTGWLRLLTSTYHLNGLPFTNSISWLPPTHHLWSTIYLRKPSFFPNSNRISY